MTVPALPPAPAAPVEGGAPEANPSAGGLPTPRRWWAMLALLGGIVLVVLDTSIANVALPAIAQALLATPADAVWVATAYQLAVVVCLLPAAALGERVGYHRVFTAGLLLFVAASLLCALAPSLPWLIVGRCLQGVGSGSVMPLGLALLRFTYPRALLGRAIAWNALTVAGASAAGPAVGAALLTVADWRWLFAINLPLGALVLAACTRLPRVPGTARTLDGLSIGLNAGFFACFVLGADQLLDTPAQGAALLALAALCGVALVRRELPRRAPLVPLDLLRSPAFRLSIVASVCCFAGQMAGTLAMPFYLLHVLDQGTLATGLLMMPWPLAVMLAAPLAGRLSDRLPTAWLCAAGAAVLALGLALCATVPMAAHPWLFTSLFTALAGLAGLGFGFFQTPNNRNMLLNAPPERSGAAGGAQSTARLTGQTLGSLMIGLLFHALPVAQAVQWGLGASAVLALVAGGVSLLRGPGGRRGGTLAPGA
ncbi:MFS transporter [Ideonella livida]|uniref:MFS transporter n=1 Tax=Ideonella livida TaxID=2707176 RepID=A0A7C9PIJ2_9BURK|nr:MFS transporter [Ideonella livida]NDY92895.1 MFS transporter [Ideonella livida]